MVDGKALLPFDPKRFFYIYGVPEGESRGFHALKKDEEFLVALHGSFTILVDDGESAHELRLDRPDRGLYIPPLVWHVLYYFEPGSLCGVLASAAHDPDGYHREYEAFLKDVRARRALKA